MIDELNDISTKLVQQDIINDPSLKYLKNSEGEFLFGNDFWYRVAKIYETDEQILNDIMKTVEKYEKDERIKMKLSLSDINMFFNEFEKTFEGIKNHLVVGVISNDSFFGRLTNISHYHSKIIQKQTNFIHCSIYSSSDLMQIGIHIYPDTLLLVLETHENNNNILEVLNQKLYNSQAHVIQSRTIFIIVENEEILHDLKNNRVYNVNNHKNPFTVTIVLDNNINLGERRLLKFNFIVEPIKLLNLPMKMFSSNIPLLALNQNERNFLILQVDNIGIPIFTRNDKNEMCFIKHYNKLLPFKSIENKSYFCLSLNLKLFLDKYWIKHLNAKKKNNFSDTITSDSKLQLINNVKYKLNYFWLQVFLSWGLVTQFGNSVTTTCDIIQLENDNYGLFDLLTNNLVLTVATRTNENENWIFQNDFYDLINNVNDKKLSVNHEQYINRMEKITEINKYLDKEYWKDMSNFFYIFLSFINNELMPTNDDKYTFIQLPASFITKGDISKMFSFFMTSCNNAKIILQIKNNVISK